MTANYIMNVRLVRNCCNSSYHNNESLLCKSFILCVASIFVCINCFDSIISCVFVLFFVLLIADSPWCEIKATHAGIKHVKTKFESKKKEKFVEGMQVKGRNEPSNLIQVLEVIAGVRNEDIDELAECIAANTERLFALH